jgi:hypothetical protein
VSAVNFLSQLIPDRPDSDLSRQVAESLKAGLSQCVERDEQGRTKLSFALPDASVLDRLAESLSKLLAR